MTTVLNEKNAIQACQHISDQEEMRVLKYKLQAALTSDNGWHTPLGELVGIEIGDMLKQDGGVDWCRAADRKFEQYRQYREAFNVVSREYGHDFHRGE